MRRFIYAAIVAALLCLPAAAQNFDTGKDAYDTGDYDSALRELQPLARAGHTEAQFLLGMIHGNGFGVRRNRAISAYWYQRAAEKGHALSQLHLGFYYRRGYGVPQDLVISHMWTDLAVELGHAKAVEWRDKVALEMTPDEIAEARARAKVWLQNRNKLY